MQNPVATRTINLQPYSVFTYEGVLDLTPTIDTWVETREQPDLVIRDNTAYNAIRDMSDEMLKLNLVPFGVAGRRTMKRPRSKRDFPW